jgi:cysteine synthase A
MIHDHILSTIGNTPVIRLNRMAPKQVEMYVKAEAFNPGGSVKDRLAHAIIADAERRGVLRPGQTVVEATSGNTGIALAMVCAVKGYPFVAVMVETFSIERRKIMRAYGAKVILTPAAGRGTEMVRRAKNWQKRTAGSWPGNSRTRPIRRITGRPPARKSCRISPAGASTTGSPAGAPAAP